MTTPQEPHSRQFSHINGSAAELLDRLAIAELCKGWPIYRDNSEWMNYRSLFTKDAVVWTSISPICFFSSWLFALIHHRSIH